MANIIKGTTPTFKKTFNTVAVTDISAAYLSVKKGSGDTVLEKALSDATTGTNYIAWKLTQEETLALGDRISVMVNWKLSDGTRGATKKQEYFLETNYKNEVI